jgi:hypothetical protein
MTKFGPNTHVSAWVSISSVLYTGSRGMALNIPFVRDTLRRRDDITRETFFSFLGFFRSIVSLMALHTGNMAYQYASQSCNWRAGNCHFLIRFLACFFSSRPPNASPALVFGSSSSDSSSTAWLALRLNAEIFFWRFLIFRSLLSITDFCLIGFFVMFGFLSRAALIAACCQALRARHFLTGKNSVLVLSPISFPSALTLRFVSFGVTCDAIMFAAVVNVYTLGSKVIPALIA